MISNGAFDKNDVRSVKSVVGIKVIDAELITTNIHISSDAVSFMRFLFSNFSITDKPSGVAAFESPNRFAVILIEIAPAVSVFLSIVGKSQATNGERSFCTFFAKPERSAISNSPVQRHIIPSKEITNVMAFEQPSKTLFVTSSVVPAKKEKTYDTIIINTQM